MEAIANCAGCGRLIAARLLSGTEKCPECVGVDIHNYRAYQDRRMKSRDYPNRQYERAA